MRYFLIFLFSLVATAKEGKVTLELGTLKHPITTTIKETESRYTKALLQILPGSKFGLMRVPLTKKLKLKFKVWRLFLLFLSILQ